MPKLFLLIGAVLLLFGFQFWNSGLHLLYEEYPGAPVCFYTGVDQTVSYAAAPAPVRSGNTLIFRCAAAEARVLRGELKSIKGESICFEGGFSDAKRAVELYKAKVLGTEVLDGGDYHITVIYVSSPYLNRAEKVNGAFINMQIAVNEGTGFVTIGIPLILGSF